MQVLCFHGRSQTGQVFRSRLENLEKISPECTFHFPDGPISIINEERDNVKSWFDDQDHPPPTFANLSNSSSLQPTVVIGFSQGGLLAIATALKFDSVRLVIVAGAPVDQNSWLDLFFLQSSACKRNRNLEVVFLVGNQDAVVPMESSRALFQKLERNLVGSTLVFEEFLGKHHFPNSKQDIARYRSLLQKQFECVGVFDSIQLQQDELEVLKSIFGDDLMNVQRNSPKEIWDLGFKVLINLENGPSLMFTPQFGYPNGLLSVEVEGREYSKALEASRAVASVVGEARVFECVSAFQEAQAASVEVCDDEHQKPVDNTESEQEMISACNEATKIARTRVYKSSSSTKVLEDSRRGEWRFCVGLIGKPSAGKSSCFNAYTAQTSHLGLHKPVVAQVGAQPFTTIDPNIGFATCQYKSDLQTTVVVKDVAGLVPGAYKGLGKGNRFLNDLLDASALLHICDGSGSSDDNGNIGSLEDVNPEQVSKDALWVLREVHLWIYNNVTSKWPVQKKRAPGSTGREESRIEKRVCELFAGYHVPPGMVKRAAKLAQLDLEQAHLFDRFQRHLLCACLIAIRFPVVLVLNKFDQVAKHKSSKLIFDTATDLMMGKSLVVWSSARVENELFRLSSSKVIENYSPISHAKIIFDEKNEFVSLYNNELGCNTGLHDALFNAIACANPIVVTAVLAGGKRHSFLFYRGSVVIDLYHTCLRSNFISGEFVRAEDVNDGKLLPRDASLMAHPTVRILTNRRI